MLLSYKVKNFKTFKNQIEMSFVADMHIKRFLSNAKEIDGENILKVSSIYGPNNTGKSCLIEALYALRKVMLNEKSDEFYNSFYDDTVTEFESIYEVKGNVYRYIVHFDSKNSKYLYERLDKVKISTNYSYDSIFERNDEKFDIKLDKKIKLPLNYINNNFPVFLMFSFKETNTEIEKAEKDYFEFAKSIVMINMELPINISKTISLMQNNAKASRFITSFAKNCDLNIEDFGYSNNVKSDIELGNTFIKYIDSDSTNKEMLKLWSKHHGYVVPIAFFDSIGTRKIIALAGYIYDMIVNGGVLLVDELDSSLHHVIIRAIIAIFNNMVNEKAQLIFSTHDALTMDLRRLFRKDQIYLTDIDENGDNRLIQLSKEFTARDENGIRGNEDIVNYYLKGRFGGIPTPDLFDSVVEAVLDE